MRGFMCQSVEVTSVCTITDLRSVIVPVRPGKTSAENKRLLKGSQLSEQTTNKQLHPRANYRRLSTFIVPSLETEDDWKKNHASSGLRVPWKQFDPNANCERSSSALVPISVKTEDDRKNRASSGRCDPIKQLTLGSPSSDNVFQVVVMRVSLHCQGCAGKVKKHLSKMEGVTSYNIDLEAKRVTVMGNVSPDGVLESVSKIKRAEFWPN